MSSQATVAAQQAPLRVLATAFGAASRLGVVLCALEKALGLAEERDHTSVWRHEESSK